MKVHIEPNLNREFDAHIYYHPDDRLKAVALRDRFREAFDCQDITIGKLIDDLVGPHSLPMFEINFKRIDFERVNTWLCKNRGEHTVLIHEVTGDDPRDHTVGATWLGTPVSLNFKRLDPSPSEDDGALVRTRTGTACATGS